VPASHLSPAQHRTTRVLPRPRQFRHHTWPGPAAVQCSAGRRRATATATATARRHVTSHVVAPAATCPARRRSRSATTATRHGAFASRPAFGHPDTRAAHASARSLARSPSASSQFRAPGVHAMRATQVLIAAARQLRPSSRCVFCGVRGLYIAGAHIFL
jgi:hypothetical protein